MTHDVKVKKTEGGETFAHLKNTVLLEKWHLHDCRRNISLALFPYSMTEVSQLCV